MNKYKITENSDGTFDLMVDCDYILIDGVHRHEKKIRIEPKKIKPCAEWFIFEGRTFQPLVTDGGWKLIIPDVTEFKKLTEQEARYETGLDPYQRYLFSYKDDDSYVIYGVYSPDYSMNSDGTRKNGTPPYSLLVTGDFYKRNSTGKIYYNGGFSVM